MSRPKTRCHWASDDDPLMQAYHDEEWGVPVHDDRKHFEYILLDGAQAGLSWRTILHRREGYRKAFHGFDPRRVAKMGAHDVRRLLSDPGIIRNRLKVLSAVRNAKAFLEIQKEFGSFDRYVWRFVEGKRISHRAPHFRELPAATPESDAMSKDLKSRGFNFVGSTICYAYMQAAGMVDDHQAGCFRAGMPRRTR
jgi:DNA-3-methyladenine glycosylase I